MLGVNLMFGIAQVGKQKNEGEEREERGEEEHGRRAWRRSVWLGMLCWDGSHFGVTEVWGEEE